MYPEHKLIFDIIDDSFTAFFVCEIILRILSEKSPLQFFKFFTSSDSKLRISEKGFWNWFDFTIVIVGVISVFGHLFEHPEFLVVSRLFSVLRVLRLLDVSDDLKAVERKIAGIIPTIFSFALLLGILLYIYSIIGIYLFSHHQYEHADFTSLDHAFLTLFQIMTLDGWSEMMYPASANYQGSWWIKVYFISFVVLTAIISFNVFVAVLTSQVHDKVMDDQKQILSNQQKNKNVLQRIEGEIFVTEEEIQSGFKELLAEIKSLRNEINDLKN